MTRSHIINFCVSPITVTTPQRSIVRKTRQQVDTDYKIISLRKGNQRISKIELVPGTFYVKEEGVLVNKKFYRWETTAPAKKDIKKGQEIHEGLETVIEGVQAGSKIAGPVGAVVGGVVGILFSFPAEVH